VGTPGNAGTVGTPGVTNAGSATGTAGLGTRAGTARTGVRSPTTNTNAPFNFNGITQSPFFADPGVRRQLNLNNNQFNTMNGAWQNAFNRFNTAANNLKANTNLSEQQRAQEMARLESQFNRDIGTSVDSTLTNPQLRNRFSQLNRQFMGFNTFNDPAIRQQLNLTPQQLREIRQLNTEWRRQMQAFQQNTGTNNPQASQAAWNQFWAQNGARLNAILTPAQQQQWAQLTGEPFVFSQSSFFPGSTTAQRDVNGNLLPNNPSQRFGPATGTNAGTTTGGNAAPGRIGVNGANNTGTNGAGQNGAQPGARQATTQGSAQATQGGNSVTR
jgi:hypothetical protein